MMDLLMKMNNETQENRKMTKTFSTYLAELSTITTSALKINKDPAFKRILKAFGWTGTRFHSDEDRSFDCAEFVQALSNLYLKGQQKMNTEFFPDSLTDFDAINYLERIASFCPDIVIECLRNKAGISLGTDLTPSTYSVKGACMLIDISNFSKYSASMCSLGIKGLDELRKATSGILGMFVKAVYEHDGDGNPSDIPPC